MNTDGIELALETSSRHGSVAVARGGDMLASVELEQQRHATHLLPAIHALAERHGFQPADLSVIHVSVGPGSFTGLRVALTAAKMLARITGAKLTAVPTLDVIVRNAPTDHARVAVCLNAKKGNCYTGVYRRDQVGWTPILEPTLRAPAALLDQTDGPLAVIGDKLPDCDWPARVTLLSAEHAVPRASIVLELGQQAANAGRFVDPYQLVPLYVRLPEAEEVWRARQASTQPAEATSRAGADPAGAP